MHQSKVLLPLFALLFNVVAWSQITLTPGQTVEQLAQDVLTGSGLNALNITFNTSAADALLPQNGVQFFSIVPGTDFPFNSGVVLRTDGSPSANADIDLNALSSPYNVTNGSIIEFDFVATGDTMNFKYIFASSEYTSYTCSQFNDAFGFFLSGPGINGPYSNNAINLATIPGTNTPVAINTVNSGIATGGPQQNCLDANPLWLQHTVYFTTAYNDLFLPLGSNYNGATVALIAASGLVCNETYHIKMGVANVGDQALNSAVFLEAESFQVFGYEISVEPNIQGPTQGGLFAEACTNATLMVTRVPDGTITDTICVPVGVAGTIDPATDLLNFPTEICFPPGVDTVYFEFNPIQDNVAEGMESLTITLTSINACGVETPASVTLNVVDFYDFNYNLTPDQTVQCLTTTAQAVVTNVAGSISPYTYLWTPNGETGESITMTPGTSLQEVIPYTVTVTDFCGHAVTQTVNLIVNQTLAVNGNSGPSNCGQSTGFVTFPVLGQTGTVNYNLTGPGISGSLNVGQQNNLSSGWYYMTVTDAVCTDSDSVFVDLLNPPVAAIGTTSLFNFSPFTTTFINGSSNADSYFWDFGNGQTLATNNTDPQTITFEGEGPLDITVCVVAIQPGCSDTACIVVSILEYIPPPVFEIPNVFSPNNDGNNELWTFFNTAFVDYVELTILNRWGNVIFESEDGIPAWDGKTQSGGLAPEGTYFYKYILHGLDKFTTHEGHGFFNLVRQ